MHNVLIFSLLFLLNFSCSTPEKKLTRIIPKSGFINYEGRIEMLDTIANLYWPGTLVEINFKGTGIKGTFKDSKGDNYYNVIIDNDSLWIFRPDTSLKEYDLIKGLPEGEHNLKIYKRTEWNRGTTSFYGFRISQDADFMPAPSPKAKKIEFYGNSITAGYGVEDYNGTDRSDSIYTNNYNTYAAVTARHFNAESRYIVRSGIGITMSWVDPIMPEIYDRINPHDAFSTWDFELYQPQIVVINLLQNDSWLVKMPKSKEYKARFPNGEKIDLLYVSKEYKKFVQEIRRKYPESHIVCMLGNMSIMKKGTPWPSYVRQVVEELNDSKLYTLFVPYKETPGHPRIEEQKIMADKLIKLIEEKVNW